MTTVNLNEAATRLPEIISGLNPCEQLVIVENGEQLATLVRNAPARWPCQAGSAKHLPHRMAPDFDAPLDEFQEYVQ
jgi:hypothetical protein